jgi:hypothetical protein
MDPETVLQIGAACFGAVIGWITYRTLRRIQSTNISDLAAVLGAVGGAAVTGLFKPGGTEFGWYCIGLFIGFFAYLVITLRNDAPDWLGAVPKQQGAGGATSAPRVVPKPPPPPLGGG